MPSIFPAEDKITKPRRRRRPLRAPACATKRVLRLLESYLSGRSNRKLATKALLGCSLRTAARLTNQRASYASPIRMEWVARICAAVGKPLDDVLGFQEPTPAHKAIVGWVGASSWHEAMQAAFDCATAINLLAMSHSLSGDTLVSHRDGMPVKVRVSLSPDPSLTTYGGKYEYHHVIVTAERMRDGSSQMWFRVTAPTSTSPTGEVIHEGRLCYTDLRALIIEIYERTKNIPRSLVTESARRAKG